MTYVYFLVRTKFERASNLFLTFQRNMKEKSNKEFIFNIKECNAAKQNNSAGLHQRLTSSR